MHCHSFHFIENLSSYLCMFKIIFCPSNCVCIRPNWKPARAFNQSWKDWTSLSSPSSEPGLDVVGGGTRVSVAWGWKNELVDWYCFSWEWSAMRGGECGINITLVVRKKSRGWDGEFPGHKHGSKDEEIMVGSGMISGSLPGASIHSDLLSPYDVFRKCTQGRAWSWPCSHLLLVAQSIVLYQWPGLNIPST